MYSLEILPVAELRHIMRVSRRAGFYAPLTQWYYEHTSIQPMWDDKERLIFHVELPFTDDSRYLRYHLESWPVTGNSSDADIKIQLPTDVALHPKRKIIRTSELSQTTTHYLPNWTRV